MQRQTKENYVKIKKPPPQHQGKIKTTTTKENIYHSKGEIELTDPELKEDISLYLEKLFLFYHQLGVGNLHGVDCQFQGPGCCIQTMLGNRSFPVRLPAVLK